MRKSKLTAEQIIEAEQAKDARQQSRAKGFSKAKERDAGRAWVVDYNSKSKLLVKWGEYDNKFIIRYRGKDLVFSAEELMRWLRWC